MSEISDYFWNNGITDKKERAKIFGQYDHVRIYARDYFEKLRGGVFTVEEVDYITMLTSERNDRYRLVKEEIIPLVQK